MFGYDQVSSALHNDSQKRRIGQEEEPKMSRRASSLAVMFCGLLLAALPALAHHSLNAEFQMGKPTELKGILTKVEWDNPHVYWNVEAKDESGTVTRWSVEGLPPSYLHRNGVARTDMLALVGKEVTIHGRLAKDGSKLMFGLDFVLPDGRVIPIGPKAGDDNP
jgi:hypothetical protein